MGGRQRRARRRRERNDAWDMGYRQGLAGLHAPPLHASLNVQAGYAAGHEVGKGTRESIVREARAA